MKPINSSRAFTSWFCFVHACVKVSGNQYAVYNAMDISMHYNPNIVWTIPYEVSIHFRYKYNFRKTFLDTNIFPKRHNNNKRSVVRRTRDKNSTIDLGTYRVNLTDLMNPLQHCWNQIFFQEITCLYTLPFLYTPDINQRCVK